MGIFDYFFSANNSKVTTAVPSGSTTIEDSVDPKGILKDSSVVFKNNKVIAMNHDKEDDFIQVDFRKLSYAEVAALKDTSITNNNKQHQQQHQQTTTIDINDDLGTDITDYQLAEELQHHLNARKSVSERMTEHESYLMTGDSIDNLNDIADTLETKVSYGKSHNNKQKHKQVYKSKKVKV